MSQNLLTTSIFPIANAKQLTASYSLFRLRGLTPQHPEFHANRSRLVFELKRQTRSACVVFQEGDNLIAAVHGSADEVPKFVSLVRMNVQLEPMNQQRTISFDSTGSGDRPFCMELLHFVVQGSLRGNHDLWQPGSGSPFFQKQPTKQGRELSLFQGLAVRPCVLPTGGYGLAVDARSKFLYKEPLPTFLDRRGYRRWEGSRCVYHFANHLWYEVKINMFCDLAVNDLLIPKDDGTSESLLEHVRRIGGRPLPREVADLPNDASVVGYFNNYGDARHVPAALCYPVASMEHWEARSMENLYKPKPSERLRQIENLRDRYLDKVIRDGLTVETDRDVFETPRKTFAIPELLFGQKKILTLSRDSNDSQHSVRTTFEKWGKTRLDLLGSTDAGFYDAEPLGRQYFLVPESIMDSFGPDLTKLICQTTDELFPHGSDFAPTIVTYDDRGRRNSIDQGKKIVAAAEEACSMAGHALVIVHRMADQPKRQEDQLASLVVRELAKFEVVASVSHTEVPQRCYKEGRDSAGNVNYYTPNGKHGLLRGYARGLVLNKILLNNERWPFALAGTLNASVTIGIDVKKNTAGFILVGPNAKVIRAECSESRNEEKLSTDQIAHQIYELISKEAMFFATPINSIVIHRDGKLFDEEREGVHVAVERLRNEGLISSSAVATLLEVRKTSMLPLRFYDVNWKSNDNRTVRNPEVGDHEVFGDEGFVCTTGYPFKRSGTVRPLQVRHLEGNLTLEQCMEDIFRLSCLAFTKPDDCSRVPLTLRLLDRRLRDEAGQYDEDAFKFHGAMNEKARA